MPVSDLQSALAPVFEENFAARGELGASVSVWRDGREIASLAGDELGVRLYSAKATRILQRGP